MKATVLFFALCLSNAVHGQESSAKPRPSPLAIAAARYKDTYCKLTYSQPSKRGREVFGKLVPFDQVWRTGADEATELTVTRDLKINGADLKAGTYSVFTIPGKDRWTIIINGDLGLWGAYNYNPKTDVMRIDVPTTTDTEMVYETFTMWIDQKNDKADWQMAWDRTKVIVPIQFLEPKL